MLFERIKSYYYYWHFQLLEVVGRDSETQLEEGENLNYLFNLTL